MRLASKGKTIKIIAAFLMLLSLTACGFDPIFKVDDMAIEEDDNSEGLIVIGFSQPGAESAWRVALTDSVQAAFTEEKGYKLIYKDGKSKQDNQIKDVRTFIKQGVDYIIISPIVETGWDSVLEEAKNAGIPVIICDRNVKVSNESLYTAFIGSNFRKEGRQAIEQVCKELETETQVAEDIAVEDADAEISEIEDAGSEDDIEPATFNIVHMQGTIGSSAQEGRSAALLNAVEGDENWEIVASASGEFTKAKAREQMTNILSEIDGHTIDMVYCENDEMALGVMAALNEAGLSYGRGEGIMIVSFDGTKTALEQCLAGKINVEMECNPLQGPFLYNIIDALQRGESVPKITYVDEKYFTQESLNADIIESRQY